MESTTIVILLSDLMNFVIDISLKSFDCLERFRFISDRNLTPRWMIADLQTIVFQYRALENMDAAAKSEMKVLRRLGDEI